MEGFETHWQLARVSIRAYFYAHLSNPSLVEDCLQEVAILAWKKAPKDRGPEEFLAYCLGCAKRVYKTCLRKHRGGQLQFLDPELAHGLADLVVDHAPPPEQQSARLDALRECVAGLDPRQRELLEARYHGRSMELMKKAADEWNRSLTTLYKQLERLREALRACVEKKTGEVSS